MSPKKKATPHRRVKKVTLGFLPSDAQAGLAEAIGNDVQGLLAVAASVNAWSRRHRKLSVGRDELEGLANAIVVRVLEDGTAGRSVFYLAEDGWKIDRSVLRDLCARRAWIRKLIPKAPRKPLPLREDLVAGPWPDVIEAIEGWKERVEEGRDLWKGFIQLLRQGPDRGAWAYTGIQAHFSGQDMTEWARARGYDPVKVRKGWEWANRNFRNFIQKRISSCRENSH